MSTSTFAKTHNLIAYLEKPTESEGFALMIDFLNESSVKYALTTSPTIYTSCIKQFWITAKVKTVNVEVRIQALVDRKRVNIKESSIRRILRLDDVERTSCLTNIEIFEGMAKIRYEKPSDKLTFYKAFFSPQWKFLIHTILQCLSAKTTSWNEFSGTMASAIICLATTQKFNFSRFVQLIFNHQLGDMAYHKEIFDTPLLTKKVFANIKRVVPITTEPSTSKPQKKHKPKRKHTQESEVPLTESPAERTLPSPSNNPLPSGEDSLKLKELMDLCINLSNKVLELESEVIDIKSTYQERIKKLEGRVARLEEENMVLKELKNIDVDVEIKLEKTQAEAYNLDLDHQEKVLSIMDVNEEALANVKEVLEVVKAAKLKTEVVTTAGATKVSVPRKRRGVIIQDSEEITTTATVQPKVQEKNKGKAILIEEPKPLKRQAQIELDEEVARQLEAELNAAINWNVVNEKVKRNKRLNDDVMKYQTLKKKPLTQAQARRNIIVYLKNIVDEVNEGVKVLETEVRQEKDVEVESSKRKGERLEQEIAKKQKMKEETGELKNHLQIVTDDDAVMYSLTHFTMEQMLNNVRLQVEDESEMPLELLRLVRRQLNEGYVPQ
uniref:Synaptobrevin, longin-like domain protein n=1 Tax=Tanacetum cinerariifolium TaxID=118510 RepID=A0A6L2J4E8_TANCI|nr:hypothetical protein [Tanacetum cinerariifolium]